MSHRRASGNLHCFHKILAHSSWAGVCSIPSSWVTTIQYNGLVAHYYEHLYSRSALALMSRSALAPDPMTGSKELQLMGQFLNAIQVLLLLVHIAQRGCWGAPRPLDAARPLA